MWEPPRLRYSLVSSMTPALRAILGLCHPVSESVFPDHSPRLGHVLVFYRTMFFHPLIQRSSPLHKPQLSVLEKLKEFYLRLTVMSATSVASLSQKVVPQEGRHPSKTARYHHREPGRAHQGARDQSQRPSVIISITLTSLMMVSPLGNKTEIVPTSQDCWED